MPAHRAKALLLPRARRAYTPLWLLIVWLVTLLALPARALAQDEPNEAELARGSPIASIDVSGNRRISKSDVVSYLRERVGQPFEPGTLAQDVRELWTSGFFDDIEVDLERTDQGVKLGFMVRERPSIRAVEFEGNDEIDTDDLTEAIEIKVDTILSQPAIARSIQKIRDMYAEKGYFLAEAEAEVLPEKNNEVSVKFKITEHSQVSVKRVTFIGNDSISEEELRAVMFTGANSILNFGSGGPFRQDAFERDIAIINALYYDRGYLTVQIHTPRIMLTPDKSGIEVSITIDEGPRFKIRQFRIYEKGPDGREMEPIGGRRHLRNMVRAESGQYFNRAELVEDLGAVRTMYRDEGFANVVANPDTRLIEGSNEVDVVVAIERGPVVYFDRIEVHGNTKTRDKVIRREMEIVEGQRFSETKLEDSRRRVTALGYFERVDVSTSPGATPDRVNVEVEVVERPTGTFQVGAGFSSIESFIATAQIQQANLMGNGQNVSLNGQWSLVRRLINFSFYEPYFLDSKFSFNVSGYNQLRQYSDFSLETLGGSLTYGYPLVDPEVSLALTYTLENNQVSTDRVGSVFGSTIPTTSFRQLPLANLFDDGITSSLRPSVTYDTRDNRLFPTSGIYLRGSTELSLAEFGAETEFLQNRLVGRFYYPIGGGAVLKLNTEFGMITSPSRDGVPIFIRYFLGGILDVRGFVYRSISPRIPLQATLNPNSAVIDEGGGARFGGNMMFFDNLEIEFPIVEDVGIKGVVFTDAGNTWNLEGKYCNALESSSTYAVTNPCFSFPDDLLNLRTSYGFGLRWFSPLGPLRFEWGFPFAPLPFEESSRFEFTIGNFF
jgi:outer membrane protein insertion porin family